MGATVMRRTAPSPPTGFTLVEAVISAALILVITVGIMPLFTRSLVKNLEGRESTLSTNHSRSTTEANYPLPLDRDQLRPAVGDISRVMCSKYVRDSGWEPYACGSPQPDAEWLRQSVVEQYNINEIYDADTKNGVPTFQNPTAGYAFADDQLDSFVHIRQLVAITEGQREQDSPFGAGRRVDIVDLRGF